MQQHSSPVQLTWLESSDNANRVEIIPNKLYFTCFDLLDLQLPPTSSDVYCFTIDDKMFYEEFCLDFGPLNLGHTVTFCRLLQDLLDTQKNPELANKRIYFYTSMTDKKLFSNAATLILAYMVLTLEFTADQAWKMLNTRSFHLEDRLEPFHDASFLPGNYILTPKDCVEGLFKARKLKLFDWPNIDVDKYFRYCDLENGDMNWIVQNKFLAFAGPFEERKHFGNGYYSTTPDDFIEYFQKNNVTTVIRLNKACYDKKHFTDAGINHHDLFYPDGGNPPYHILQRFLEICETAEGAVAVHCKAGLGRTGTCIGMYMMKHYKMTAREVIGWFRIVRPGSVIGPQQQFLEAHEKKMLLDGKAYRSAIRKKLEGSASQDSIDSLKVFERKKTLGDISDISAFELDQERKLMEEESDIEVLDEANEVTQGDILNKLKAQHHHKHPKKNSA